MVKIKELFIQRLVVSFLFLFVFFGITPLVSGQVFAATLYIDGTLSGNCSGDYSISARTCSGTDGNAYTSINAGVGAGTTGDTINIRSGTYNVNSATNVNFSSDTLTTTIQAYNSESVTIANSVVSSTTFNLGSTAKNILIKNIHFTGTNYYLVTGWTNYSGNVWTATVPYSTTQIRFNTTNGTAAASIGAVDAPNEYYISGTTMYAYSVGDPTTTYTSPGINLADNFSSIGIGNPSNNSSGNLITVDNCIFENFAHTGIKGTYRWHVLNSKFINIGTDTSDHGIYPNGTQTVGNEMIFEYNYFGYITGAGIHLYESPAYAIVRYNIFNGLSGSNRGDWGVLTAGSNHRIYNNTFYGYGSGGGITLYRGSSQNNIIKNNIFSNNTSDLNIDIGSSSYPTNNTVEANYFGSNTKCTNCTDYTGSGGPNLATLDDTPPNINSTSAWTQFSYSFNKATTGNTNIGFFQACNGGASPTTGVWYLDDISIVPSGGGAEKVLNGGMEDTYSSGLAPNWSKGGSSSTWSQETTVIHGGSSAQKVNLTGGCGEALLQSISLTAGDYVLTGWAKRDSGNGTLPIYIAGGNTSFTIGSLGPSFLGTLPYSSSTDFKIDPAGTDFSLVIDVGQNLGTSYQLGFDSTLSSWPIETINQNLYGSGWDLGAFVYNDGSIASSSTSNTSVSSTSNSDSSSTSHSCDESSPDKPELFQIDVLGNSAKLFFTPLPSTNKFYISFSTNSNAEEHGAEVELAKEGVQNFTVNALKPNTIYYFKVRGQNGCMPGEWSNILKVTSKSPGLSGTISYFLYGIKSKSTYLSNTEHTNLKTVSAIPTINELDQTVTTTPTATNEPESKQQPEKKQTCFLWWCW